MSTFPAAAWIVHLVFLLALAATGAGAIIAVSTARIIRSVCGLALCCLGLAGLYYFLRSPFLALMEILVYVGAVCVTIVFAVMLAEPDEPPPREDRARTLVWAAGLLVIAGLICWALIRIASQVPPATATAAAPGAGSVEAIGTSLLTTYSLAFEMISLVLLVAILGALAIARPGRRLE